MSAYRATEVRAEAEPEASLRAGDRVRVCPADVGSSVAVMRYATRTGEIAMTLGDAYAVDFEGGEAALFLASDLVALA